MNTPVSFEIAKLLKEKGFDKRVKGFYDIEKELHINYVDEMNTKGFANRHLPKGECSAPTIAEVVMWLSNKQIDLCHIVNYTKGVRTYRMGIIYVKNNLIKAVFIKPKNDELSLVEFDSLTDAYSRAIEYTLKNLI